MTIVIPNPDIVDRVLRLLGKRRGVAVHGETTDAKSIQSYFAPKKESPLRALLRPSGRDLPEGMIDVFTLQPEDEKVHRKAHKQIRMTFAPLGPISQGWPFEMKE